MARDSINALIVDLGMLPVSTKDRFTFTYCGGVLDIQITRTSGINESAHFIEQGAAIPFSVWKPFDSESLTKKDRNKLVCNLYEQGKTQTELAIMFKQSQANISKIINANSVL